MGSSQRALGAFGFGGSGNGTTTLSERLLARGRKKPTTVLAAGTEAPAPVTDPAAVIGNVEGGLPGAPGRRRRRGSVLGGDVTPMPRIGSVLGGGY